MFDNSFFPIHIEVLLSSIPQLQVLRHIATIYLDMSRHTIFVTFLFGRHMRTSVSHLILEYVKNRAKPVLLFYVKGRTISGKECILSESFMINPVQMSVYIDINICVPKLQRFYAKKKEFIFRNRREI